MKSLITSLTGVQGVTGAAIFEEQSRKCVAHNLPLPYEPVLFVDVLANLNQIMDAYQTLDVNGARKSFSVQFEIGTLLVRFASKYVVCVLAEETAKLAILNVAFNVAKRKLGDDSISIPRIADVRITVGAGQGPGSAWNASDVSQVAGRDSERLVGSAGGPLRSSAGGVLRSSVSRPSSSVGAMSVSKSIPGALKWGSREEWSRHSNPDAVGRKVMTHVLRSFAKHVGEADARAILEAEVSALGATPMTLHASQFGDLIQSAAKKIRKRSHRQEFVAEALGDR